LSRALSTLAEPKGPFTEILFTGLKAGASTVVPLLRHPDADRFFRKL
jgi:hypothetical protein